MGFDTIALTIAYMAVAGMFSITWYDYNSRGARSYDELTR